MAAETGKDAIEALRAQWAPLFNAKKLTELCELFYAADARALPPDHPIVEGRPRIRELFANVHRAGEARFELGVVRAEASGDVGWLIGTYAFTMRAAGAPAAVSNGVTLEVYRRQPDGRWQCVVDMWHAT
ncbi:MAG TPA: DUF4440 domain-containing protein [Candidatus Binatia bacterium]|jgi:ketosteroid isomerase-like protein|nr:DUF4440 domain-containing protein [Candidatus Binatia bacterium]